MKKILICFLLLLSFSFVIKAEEVVVSNYIGNVLIWQGNQWINVVNKGVVLKEKDKIKTLQKSKVVLLFPNGSTITLSENTEVVVDELVNKVSIYIEQGKVKSKVKPLQTSQIFEVKTAVCVASIRGTEFILGYTDGQSELVVIEGKVLFTDNLGNSLDVGQHEFCSVGQKGLKEKFSISEEKINSLMEEFKDVEEVESQQKSEKGINQDEKQKDLKEKKQFEKEKLAELKEELKGFINDTKLEKHYITETIQQTKDADFQAGRTLRDIHGNLTRVEQVVSRNKDNAVEFINITKRDMYKYKGYYSNYAQEVESSKPRIDILKMGVEFNDALPQKISEWPKFISDKNKNDSLNFYPKRVYCEITHKVSTTLKDSFLQEVNFTKIFKDGKWKLDGKESVLVSNGNKTYEIDTNYDEDVKGKLPDGKSKDEDDGSLWGWVWGPLPVKGDVNGDGVSNTNKDILWLQMEGYLINNDGKILTPSYFTSGGAKDPFTMLKEIAIESIVFVRKPDGVNNGPGSNFFNKNIDLVLTPDIVLALVKQIAPSMGDIKIEEDK